MGEPAMWIERVAQLYMYRWDESRSVLERSFRSLGVKWHRRIVNEYGNSTQGTSEGGLSRCDGSDSNDEEKLEEDPKGEIDGTKIQRRVQAIRARQLGLLRIKL